MKNLKIILTFLFIVLLFNNSIADEKKDPKVLIEKMVEQVGNYDKLKSLNDVQYVYTTRDSTTGKSDISTERYIFDGELSWAEFTTHEFHVFPDQIGPIIQGYNGKDSWVTINGKLVEDPEVLKLTDFLRKTSFYWFAMMQKLLDPGINYSYEGKRKVNDIEYDVVKIGHEQGIGDVSDTYLLYINPETHLVDQFLFTVLDFNITDPFLMKVKYEEID
ncbi:MAG: DUF6503 family protein, partial [Thermodesulfobacteriota bacterium]